MKATYVYTNSKWVTFHRNNSGKIVHSKTDITEFDWLNHYVVKKRGKGFTAKRYQYQVPATFIRKNVTYIYSTNFYDVIRINVTIWKKITIECFKVNHVNSYHWVNLINKGKQSSAKKQHTFLFGAERLIIR